MEEALEFEKFIMNPVEVENKGLPGPIEEFLNLHSNYNRFVSHYGGPTAIAKHPDKGWALLGCGQGPFIMWKEDT